MLATRFSPDQGYLTESRRGGGGYIRIVRVVQGGQQQLGYLVRERIGDSLSEEVAARIISTLRTREVISQEDAELMSSAVSGQALGAPVSAEMKNVLRARIMKSMLMAVAKRKDETA